MKKYHIGSLIAFVYCFFVLNYYFYTALGIGLAVYFSMSFIDKIGKEYPIKELIALLPLFQWVVGAKLSYIFGKVHYKYYMYVGEELYMSYVVPATILLIAGLYMIKGSYRLINLKDAFGYGNFQMQNKIAKTLLFIGITSTILSSSVNVGGFGFIFYLSSLLLYVGVSYLFFLYPKRKLIFFFLTLIYLLIVSIAKGSFHNLLLVGIFLLFIVFSNKASFILKISLIAMGVFMTYSIQLIKHEYRSKVWGKKNVNYIEVFTGLLAQQYFGVGQASTGGVSEDEADQTDQAGANVRLNQGWIISKVLENVPKNQDFFHGKTVVQTLKASLLPRFLFPNKPGAEVALQNFRDISGLKLNNSTSMGLSIVAEFYANFGTLGGWLAMFIYGLFLATVIRWLVETKGHGSEVMLLWFVFFFFQVVKAETDLIKIVNHLFKSIVYFVLLCSLLRVINIELFPKRKKYSHIP